MKIILLNGPPRSGKDTAAKYIVDKYKARHYSFANVLKSGCHAFLGLSNNPNTYESCKDTPLPEFMGYTPRQFYIKFSEECIKPVFGKDFFGRCFVNWIDNNVFDDKTIIISDCGFNSEVLPLLNRFGAHNISIIQLERGGFDFRNDSREYVSPPNVKIHRIVNNGSHEEFYERIDECLKKN